MEIINENGRLVVVLGTSHDLQMAEKWPRNVDDPDYSRLIQHLVSDSKIDTIFEEASECGPTSAQKLAQRLELEYVDVDPHPNVRHFYGLSSDTGNPLDQPYDFANRTLPEEHFKREDFWVQKISLESFKVGLVICGYLHTLSLAGRLLSAGFKVDACVYVPHDKLCRKMHPTDESSAPSA